MFKGFAKRLQEETAALVSANRRAVVVAASDRQQFVWIGGSILASLSTMAPVWVTSQEYDETGPSIAYRRGI